MIKNNAPNFIPMFIPLTKPTIFLIPFYLSTIFYECPKFLGASKIKTTGLSTQKSNYFYCNLVLIMKLHFRKNQILISLHIRSSNMPTATAAITTSTASLPLLGAPPPYLATPRLPAPFLATDSFHVAFPQSTCPLP